MKDIYKPSLYGKIHKYQNNKETKGPNDYRIDLIKAKAKSGIIKENILNLKSSARFLNDWAENKGYKNYEEYLNIIALARGFTCYGEYSKVWKYYPGMPNAFKENRLDTRFLGVYIAENAVAKLFPGSKRMPLGNPGYDIICPKGRKIDVKSTVLNQYNNFVFRICRNMIADYFVLLGFNNIIELEPRHIYIIRGDEELKGCHMRDLDSLVIANEINYLDKYKKYERIDKLEELKNICSSFDAKNKIDTTFDSVPNKNMVLEIILRLRIEGNNDISSSDILHRIERIEGNNDISSSDILHRIEKFKRERLEKKVPLDITFIKRENCKRGYRR